MTQDQSQHFLAPSAASPPLDTPSPIVNTPPSEGASYPLSLPSDQCSRGPSPCEPNPQRHPGGDPLHPQQNASFHKVETGFDSDLDFEEDEEDMGDRPALHRHADGRSQLPLLKDERGRSFHENPNGSARPAFVARRSTFRSKSPDLAVASATRKKYTYAAFFLGLSLISFVIQTETAIHIQHSLGWKKPYCMLWVEFLSPKMVPRLTVFFLDTLLMAHGPFYGLLNYLFSGFKRGPCPGRPSGSAISLSSVVLRKWYNLRTYISLVAKHIGHP